MAITNSQIGRFCIFQYLSILVYGHFSLLACGLEVESGFSAAGAGCMLELMEHKNKAHFLQINRIYM